MSNKNPLTKILKTSFGIFAGIILFFMPILLVAGMVLSPLGFIKNFFDKEPSVTSTIIPIHFETEDGLKEMLYEYQPAVSAFEYEWQDYGVNVPLNYLTTTLVMSETPATYSIIYELINDCAYWFEEVIHDIIDPETGEKIGEEIEIIPHLNSVAEYVSLMKMTYPFSEKFEEIDDQTLIEFIRNAPNDYGQSSVSGGMDNGGMATEMPDNLDELREEYDFIYPLDSGYTITADYNEWYNAVGTLKYHDAVDLANGREGGSIYSSTDGVVSYSTYVGQKIGNKVSDVNAIIIDYKDVRVWYWHMKYPPNFSVGDTVNQGDILGYVGNTGKSSGPHLHYQTQLNGVTVSPHIFIDFDREIGY